MKVLRTALVLLPVAAASAAYVFLRPTPQTAPPVTPAEPVAVRESSPVAEVQSNEVAVPVEEPVQPLEERGDAMLFEIDALQNTPFDHAITMPFD